MSEDNDKHSDLISQNQKNCNNTTLGAGYFTTQKVQGIVFKSGDKAYISFIRHSCNLFELTNFIFAFSWQMPANVTEFFLSIMQQFHQDSMYCSNYGMENKDISNFESITVAKPFFNGFQEKPNVTGLTVK